MLDFVKVSWTLKKDTIEIYPKFIVGKTKDLMVRGGDFYAIWDDERCLWSTDEFEALTLIDKELDSFAKEHKEEFINPIRVMHIWDSDTGQIDKWHKFVQKQMQDYYHPLDEKLIFGNVKTKRDDYASHQLNYPLEEGDISAYDKLMTTLYDPEERMKLEWAIGSIISGDSKKNQKFIVLYGSAGTGKSTVLNIIQDLFDGYYTAFDAKALGSNNDSFALEPFSGNPLVAIQHDGDLSKIEDNTRLNSIVSHELMTVNQKFKSLYSARINAFLFMGTNRPVKITDAKSGILRRLIDVSPSGRKMSSALYKSTMNQIKFELGGIAYHCLEVYNNNKDYYDDYQPISMMGASNDFFNFMMDSFDLFERQNGTTLKQAWELYKTYCDDANISYPYSQRVFKEELKNYFEKFEERATLDDEEKTRVRNYYSGFLMDKFLVNKSQPEKVQRMHYIEFKEQPSLFDEMCADCLAQYGTDDEVPQYKWDTVKTKVKDLDTSKLHYVRLPKEHIVIDFDLKDKSGNKSFKRNLEEASKWPATYAELSKSGQGIHLHYIFAGDVTKLSSIYDEDVEIKVFTGKRSLRRKLTKCSNQPIATLNSGLPLTGGKKKVVDATTIKSEQRLRELIKRNLNKEIHDSTKCSVDFIKKLLDDAYDSGLHYDVRDMEPTILRFASNSTNNASYCIRTVGQMKFKSEDASESIDKYSNENIVFFDVEVFPNLFLINWKFRGKDQPVRRLINPSPAEVEELMSYKLVGFNNRLYDNHILWARMQGYNNLQLYKLSDAIVNDKRSNHLFGEAYNVSYTDIYDFSSKKQSLKKFEIELGLHHQELGFKWNEPVPEDKWELVAKYCDNDVIATEATFEARYQDFVAREILADIAGGSVNDTTNSLTTKIIFGNERNPQKEFVYTDLSEMFPGYKFENGHSWYRDEDPGEGGYVYAEPGMYTNVALLDVASMHPTSIENLNLFGPYTKNFSELKQARIYIKHKDYKSAGELFGGKLKKYLTSDDQAKALSYALKIAINSVYGLTSAKFNNKCKDPRNVDNIVAKRGSLFMINLKHEVQERGFTVAHIKTDSIKIPDATPEIIQFVMEYGKQYGYTFEHEATYEKMCLVNNSVYIAKENNEWTATGAQFQVPYVFKKLFNKEKIEFNDLCETKSVTTSLYLDMNENLNEDEHNYVFVGKVGQFCPIKPGHGGGLLLREKEGKYSAVTGSKGYRWLESEVVKNLGKENDIDRSYYDSLCDDAIISISEYGDYEWFVSD